MQTGPPPTPPQPPQGHALLPILVLLLDCATRMAHGPQPSEGHLAHVGFRSFFQKEKEKETKKRKTTNQTHRK